MRATLYPCFVTQQFRRERLREGALPHSRRPVEEVGVGKGVVERGAKQALGLGLLRDFLERVQRSPWRSLPAGGFRRPPRSAAGTFPPADDRRWQPAGEIARPSAQSDR